MKKLLALSLGVAVALVGGCGAALQKTTLPDGTLLYNDRPLRHWVEDLQDCDPVVRSEAVQTLHLIGPDAGEAVPALIRACRDDSVRLHALYTLGDLGSRAEAAVPTLLEALADGPAAQRAAAAFALGRIGARPREVVPVLLEALRSDDAQVRASAVWALGRFGPDAKAAVPLIIPVLREKQGQLCCTAAQALGCIGPDARGATPALKELLHDREELVRGSAAVALVQLGEGTDGLPVLADVLPAAGLRNRIAFMALFAGFGPRDTAAVPALIDMVRQTPPIVRSYGLLALGQIGPGAREAVPTLLLVLREQDAELRETAGRVLLRVDPAEAARAGVEDRTRLPVNGRQEP